MMLAYHIVVEDLQRWRRKKYASCVLFVEYVKLKNMAIEILVLCKGNALSCVTICQNRDFNETRKIQ